MKIEYDKLFPDQRLEGESTLRQAQLVMLRILRIVDCICRKHDINYWLDAGTLLGAVRHGGFIPWDDDIDISMTRKDFERFSKIIATELPEDLFFQTKETDPAYYPYVLPKVRDKKSKFVEDRREVSYCQGIYIDVFQYDTYPNHLVLNLLRWRHTIRAYRNRFPRKSLKRKVYMLALYTVGLPSFVFLRGFEWFMKKFRDVVCNRPGQDLITYGVEYADKIPYTQEDIFPLRDISFEGFSFLAPNNVDVYLKKTFGDYMQLPPEDKRIPHAKEVYINITK